MAYVEGFVIPVKASDRAAYLDVATKAAALFREFGALRVVECWPDDVAHGHTTDFHRAVKVEEGEVPVFAWIEWPDRRARDAGFRAAMDDPRMAEAPMPFDGKRMIFGGFVPILDTQGEG
ncbi:DUF1428 domain-containing protein [Sphingomonas sp. AP4-R1]|uniref:DUF1428 domain-containing protein n=1 Tax=Sphingomonas sp. AP4-R1 TaxID=2735134 RepID=UPI0014937B6F|nr:DUF1428 domain-containing protein [Sphingomonas sp. AP4-R1]QJU56790.1 DUF1428 domain-containing protein [Sphingomonas sp. AP4-R1]